MKPPLRVVHVGCGGMAAVWLEAATALPELVVVGLVDLDLGAAARRRDAFAPAARISTDAGVLITELRPEVVFNCTVPAAHHAVTTLALRSGAHVLSEKPLAASRDEAQALVGEAAQAQRLLAVTQNYRYAAAPRTVREALAGGLIGDVTTFTCDFFDAPHFGGFREEMEHPLLLEMAVHHFDLARFFGAADPVRVSCTEWNPRGSWFQRGASAHAVFTCAAGEVFSYRGSWCAEGLRTRGHGTWRFNGTRGTLTWDGADAIIAETVAGDSGFHRQHRPHPLTVRPAPGRDRSHASVMAEFVRCVRGGGVPETHAADNLTSLAMVFGAIESAGSEAGVELNGVAA